MTISNPDIDFLASLKFEASIKQRTGINLFKCLERKAPPEIVSACITGFKKVTLRKGKWIYAKKMKLKIFFGQANQLGFA